MDNKSPDSLKYWYKRASENARSVYQMRPVTKNLLLRILYPGVKVNRKDKRGAWLSFDAAVVKGGYNKLSPKAYPVRKGATTLMRDAGQAYPVNWQFMSFENVRVRKQKKWLGKLLGCERKYKQF